MPIIFCECHDQTTKCHLQWGRRMPLPLIKGDINSDSVPLNNHHSWIDDIKEVLECYNCIIKEDCFLNLPSNMDDNKPLDLEAVKEEQANDDTLQARVIKYPDCYLTKRIGKIDNIICHLKPGDNPANWKIALPQSLLLPAIKWFHQVTGHPGAKQILLQISARYYHSDLQRHIDKFHCEHCQQNKLNGKGYGLLPE